MIGACPRCGSLCNCTRIHLAPASTNYDAFFERAWEAEATRALVEARARSRKGFYVLSDETAEESEPHAPDAKLVRPSPPKIVGGGPMRRRWR